MLDRLRERLSRALEPSRTDATRRAAVALILREVEGRLEILFIRRSVREGDPWSGHMAFPGGRAEHGDPDLFHTALRETREELGLDLACEAEYVGVLSEELGYARGERIDLTILPFVFLLHGAAECSPNQEVDAVLWADLQALFGGQLATTLDYVHQGNTLRLPGHRVGEDVVWGLTYRMLESLFETIR